jgi:hypothetical protein
MNDRMWPISGHLIRNSWAKGKIRPRDSCVWFLLVLRWILFPL